MNLDEYQQAAALDQHPRILCTAGPGTGKSTTLCARLRHMVEDQHMTPSRIVAITFTRMGAKEIRAKLGSTCRGIYVGTLHAFCLKMIQEMGAHLGYERDWLTIMPDEDAELDMKEVLADLGLIRRQTAGRFDWCKVGSKAWERFVNDVTSGAIERDTDKDKAHEPLWEAWDAFRERLQAQNVLTYGTILTEAVRLLQDKKALAWFREQYRHFLIDEAQDTSHIQWAIIWQLVAKVKPATLFVVGDVDQALYSWRGAVPDIMVKMAREPKTKLIQLGKTYRFGPGIADPAKRLIAHNPDRIPSDMIPCGYPDSKTVICRNMTMLGISDMIQGWLADGALPLDVAVLSRTHAAIEELADILKADRIPATKIGKIKSLRQSAPYRVVMGYIRLAANKWDRRAFMAITAAEHLTTEAIRNLREHTLKTREPLRDLYFGRDLFVGSTAAPGALVHAISTYLRKKDPATNYDEALNYLIGIEYTEGLMSAAAIVNHLGLADMQDELETVGNTVTLCTIHAAKGREWPIVVTIGMNEQTFPSSRSMNEGREHEERNLCYVALTRAKKLAVFCHMKSDRMFDGESKFIGEMDLKAAAMMAAKEEDNLKF